MDELFVDSGFSHELLKQIWDLSDLNRDGKLDELEFSIARFIIAQVYIGAELPKSVPESLVESLRKQHGSEFFTKEEEEQLELLRASRGRSNAFYRDLAPPPTVSDFQPSYSSSALAYPSSEPRFNQDSKIRCESSRFTIGYAETIGRRATMEDELIIYGHFRNNATEEYCAVFDGHGGNEVSKLAANTLHV